MASKIGLSAKEVSVAEKAVKEISKGGKLPTAELDPAILAASGAGAAASVEKANGVNDDKALEAALRAAGATGCSPSDVRKAMAAAAASLHSKKAVLPESTLQGLRLEALKLGFSEADADKIVEGTSEGARGENVSQQRLAAAKAGAAAEMAKLKKQDSITTWKDLFLALDGIEISSSDLSKVLLAASEITKKSKEGAAKGSKEVDKKAREKEVQERIGIIVAAAIAAIKREGNSTSEVAASVEDSARTDGEKLPLADESRTGVKKTGQSSKLEDLAKNGAKKAKEADLEDVKKALRDKEYEKVIHSKDWDKEFHERFSTILDVLDAVTKLASNDKGMLLMPSGYDAMLDLCQAVQSVGKVSSMLGPTWAFHQRIDWVSAVALHTNATMAKGLYSPLLDTHVNGRRALLEVHTTFPSLGAGGADWVVDVRKALAAWELSHPGYKAQLAGGAAESADTRDAVMSAMWPYLTVSVTLIMVVVYASFQSIMVPIRLAVALFFTLAATFGVGAIVYQTPLLHGWFPDLVHFHGLSFEVVPLVTGVAIALGLDYDIFLVSRIVEFRLQRFSDRASVFRGVIKTGDVISGAGLIMALAFTGLCFSDKLLFQQFGVLLITSVMFDTFVVRTILVPALMLVAQDWNWWPRMMPPAIHDVLEGEVESSGGVSRSILHGTALGGISSSCNGAPSPIRQGLIF
eukprot:TRINITY_DN50181_c0_g1_i1.p1 TRINITY_DN50181_c0_g1~~TRINITY_DN50181_c0_g1_i1.p1  ORF type:complete len:734 (+),score=166.45 TRINITY_DN50181_c0_g1_i1:127-2202(+)